MADADPNADPALAVPLALEAGIAAYNAGLYQAAREPLEAARRPLESGTDDERLLYGLVGITAAVHNAATGERRRAVEFAESALDSVGQVPAGHRGVDLQAATTYCERLAAEPGHHSRHDPPSIPYKESRITPHDLSVDALALAATAVAERAGIDLELVAAAAERAREERATGRTRYRTLLGDLVTEPAARPIASRRLRELVDREQRKQQDVAGLFE